MRRHGNHHRSQQQHSPTRAAAPRARAVHLVDIDNLVGDPATTDQQRIGATVAAYRELAGVADGDHVVVATSTFGWHALAVSLAWPGVLRRWRSGPDGADLLLLGEARWAVEVDRFDRVVIGSGDHIFVEVVDRCEARGLPVQVVCRRAGLARVLGARAGAVAFLPEAGFTFAA